jgi:hypothetical protein
VLSRAIFARLPADARARCALVCPAWADTLTDVSLWTRLDLSASSGVRVRVTNAVLSGAAAKARGCLESLDVSGGMSDEDTLLAVVQDNAETLRELRMRAGMATG